MLVSPSGEFVTSNPELRPSLLSECGDAGIRELVLYPSEKLKQRALEVVVFDDGLRKLAGDLAFTMYSLNGIGLAATQIGEPRRVLVIDILNGNKKGRSQLVVMVNPVIGWLSDEVINDHEGCLSFPMIRGIVPRRAACVVEGQGIDGEWWTVRAERDLARAIQHEVDHLDGVTMLERMNREHRSKTIAVINQFAGMIQKDMNRSDTAAKERKALEAKKAEVEAVAKTVEEAEEADLEAEEPPRGELEEAAVADDQGFKSRRKIKIKRVTKKKRKGRRR